MTQCLLHTGFAKAGSTFLQEWFEVNPQLRFTPHAIAGFRSVFQIADLAHEQPNHRYRYFVTSNELLGSGGRIPYGCALFSFRMLKDSDLRQGQRNICRVLHGILPDARVIIVTRGFEGIIRSLYSQYVKLGGRRVFRAFLEQYSSILVQWLDVDFHLRLYRETFGRDRLLVLPYELLRADAAGFLRRLEGWLGLDHVDSVPGPRNESLTPDKLYWYAALSRFFVSPIADRFGPATAARIYSFYGFKVVQTNRLGWAIRLLNGVWPRTENLAFPDGYLDRFRGMASSLAGEEAYQAFLPAYFVPAPGVERLRA